ncbi:MAG: hypothetical protein OEY34_03770 [Cyclobacteriaceae bacterium]|nr:hypothetical protein [Cyclobacteriaceae bacterium]
MNSKIQIIETVNELDMTQAEKVLHFIKGVLTSEREKDMLNYSKFKENAMHEIREALRMTS